MLRLPLCPGVCLRYLLVALSVTLFLDGTCEWKQAHNIITFYYMISYCLDKGMIMAAT